MPQELLRKAEECANARHTLTLQYNACVRERAILEIEMEPIELDMRTEAIQEGGNDKARDVLYKEKLLSHTEYQIKLARRNALRGEEEDLQANIKLQRDLGRLHALHAEALIKSIGLKE